ncbi:LexA family transcriptional regulator [Microbulbifer sp. MLAF003]|uniref:S24 family peptidase n=1 Tax=Microbulbifer sp. MLAF003 TaxID=3032582 RepID=UPI0024AD6114|nr:LexA family transcriptional regulator [Microbulbifer sp. MLAF003]WHI52961.1 LexA family transcriptional regulator [Microbulbifer sp. MLAF003]
MNKSKRKLTDSEMKLSEGLRRIWLAKKGELGLNQEKAGAAMGMTQGAVGHYLNGRIALNTETIIKFARLLHVEPSDIDPNQVVKLGRRSNPSALTENAMQGVSNASRSHFSIPPHRSTVPLISSVQAGGWAEVVDNFQPGDAEEWRETTAKVGPNAFALRIEGDSMTSPTGVSIPHGSIVIVDPDVEYTNGSIVVAKLIDVQEATIKKLVIDGPNRYLKPLNPNYAPIPINGNCRIVGVAKKVEIDL